MLQPTAAMMPNVKIAKTPTNGDAKLASTLARSLPPESSRFGARRQPERIFIERRAEGTSACISGYAASRPFNPIGQRFATLRTILNNRIQSGKSQRTNSRRSKVMAAERATKHPVSEDACHRQKQGAGQHQQPPIRGAPSNQRTGCIRCNDRDHVRGDSRGKSQNLYEQQQSCSEPQRLLRNHQVRGPRIRRRAESASASLNYQVLLLTVVDTPLVFTDAIPASRDASDAYI